MAGPGRSGRPSKPTEAKRRAGNPGKRALGNGGGQLAAVPEVLPDPIELDPAETLEAVLEAAKPWLAVTDTTALALLREALEERTKLRELVITTNNSIFRKELRELDKQIIVELSTLGLDPTARARLGLAEVKAQTTLDKLRTGRGK